MRLFLVVAAALAAFPACVTADKVPGPDGKAAYSISCYYGMTACYEKAATLCPGGYTPISTTSSSWGSSEQNLFVQCKA